MPRAGSFVVGLITLSLVGGCGAPGGSIQSGETPAANTLQLASVQRMQAIEAVVFLKDHPDALVLDVRDPGEWNDDVGHIEGAKQIPLAELSGRLAEIEGWKERPVVCVCREGVRSRAAAQALVQAGHRQVFNLEGGMLAWRQAEGVGP